MKRKVYPLNVWRTTLFMLAFILVVGSFGFVTFASPVYIYSGDFHLRIPADPNNTKGWMDDAIIEIPDHFLIADLDVGISLTHSEVFDLWIYLQGPTGTSLCLNKYGLDEYLNGEDYTQTIFDDEAEIPIEQGQPPFTGRFRPKSGSLLSIFDGLEAYGTWRLQIYDAFYADIGFLDHFELTLEIPEPATLSLFALGGLALLRKRRIKKF